MRQGGKEVVEGEEISLGSGKIVKDVKMEGEDEGSYRKRTRCQK